MSYSFQALFCREYQCQSCDFEEHAFWKCIYRHAWPLARVIYKANPAFFREDFGFLRDLATASCRGEVLTELNRFYGRNVRDRNWFRKQLHLRISGKRVLILYRQLLRAHLGGPQPNLPVEITPPQQIKSAGAKVSRSERASAQGF